MCFVCIGVIWWMILRSWFGSMLRMIMMGLIIWLIWDGMGLIWRMYMRFGIW